jgi:putative pyruvate formate lyase activating enzyme
MFESYFGIINGSLVPRQFISKRMKVDLITDEADEISIDGLLDVHRKYSHLFDDTPNPTGFLLAEDGDMSLYDLKVLIASRLMSPCMLCENRCGSLRFDGETGRCGVGTISRYASEFIHMGEEAPIIPSHTIFFTGCTFGCIHCQNWDIATSPNTGVIFNDHIIELIESRHTRGARNVNLVGGNPDQHLYNILKIFTDVETHTPIVWNSNTFASSESMELLKGFADLHLADFKYGNDSCGKEISGVDDYWSVVTRNLSFAYTNSNFLIRHLVLPGHVHCCTEPIAQWCAGNIPECGFNLMFQYHPEYEARKHPQLRHHLSENDVAEAMEAVRNLDLHIV